jgi:hypothetical protein
MTPYYVSFLPFNDGKHGSLSIDVSAALTLVLEYNSSPAATPAQFRGGTSEG